MQGAQDATATGQAMAGPVMTILGGLLVFWLGRICGWWFHG
jgi:hypothetical protein